MQKLLFPFRNPLVIVLCLIYAAFQLAFVVCAGFSGAAASDNFETEQTTVILNDGAGWAIFFFIAATMGALANAYVFIEYVCICQCPHCCSYAGSRGNV